MQILKSVILANLCKKIGEIQNLTHDFWVVSDPSQGPYYSRDPATITYTQNTYYIHKGLNDKSQLAIE